MLAVNEVEREAGARVFETAVNETVAHEVGADFVDVDVGLFEERVGDFVVIDLQRDVQFHGGLRGGLRDLRQVGGGDNTAHDAQRRAAIDVIRLRFVHDSLPREKVATGEYNSPLGEPVAEDGCNSLGAFQRG
jgi:hypothetical protein